MQANLLICSYLNTETVFLRYISKITKATLY